MKKIVTLLMLVTLTSVSAQQSVNTIDYKTNFNSAELLEIGKTILDPVEKHEFYKHLFTVYEIDNLKATLNDLKVENEFGEENDELRNKSIEDFQQLPNPMLYDFVKKQFPRYAILNEKPINIKDLDKKDEYEEFTLREKINQVDKSLIANDSSFHYNLRTLISLPMCGSMLQDINKNIITVYSDCGTGASITFNYILFKDNTFIDLGTGFGKLTKSEFKKLEKIIKKKVKDYSYPAARSGAQISQRPNGNFFITFRGYTDDDAGASGGSIEITYETKDLKTFIPNSVTVEKLEWQSVGE